MFELRLILPKAIRALSSVGRASPLQGEGQKFESSNAHHKRDDDICYHLFYFCERMGSELLTSNLKDITKTNTFTFTLLPLV